jgi:predicted transcriptional regulator
MRYYIYRYICSFERLKTNMSNFFAKGERRAVKDKTLMSALTEERKRQGVSQYVMADRMNTQQPSLARMEKEIQDPHLSRLLEYAQVLGKRITWIIEDA